METTWMDQLKPEDWTNILHVEREMIPENAEDFRISSPEPVYDSKSGCDDWRLVAAPTPWIERKPGLYVMSTMEGDIDYYYLPCDSMDKAMTIAAFMMVEDGCWWESMDLGQVPTHEHSVTGWLYSNKGSITEEY